jgi:hypothetical protein
VYKSPRSTLEAYSHIRDTLPEGVKTAWSLRSHNLGPHTFDFIIVCNLIDKDGNHRTATWGREPQFTITKEQSELVLDDFARLMLADHSVYKGGNLTAETIDTMRAEVRRRSAVLSSYEAPVDRLRFTLSRRDPPDVYKCTITGRLKMVPPWTFALLGSSELQD